MELRNNKYLLISIALFIVICIVIYFKFIKNEHFEHFGMAVDIPDGIYSITSTNDIELSSDKITPVICNDFEYRDNSQLSLDLTKDWKLKRVAKGVYIFMKPNDRECLYTSADESIRTYQFSNCASKNSKSLCGVTQKTYDGNLDELSLHSYFMLLKSPEGKYYIKSMINDMYLCMNGNKLTLKQVPTMECLFNIQKVD